MPNGIEYDQRTGQYRGSDGRFVGRSRIESLVQGEVSHNQDLMRDLTTKLIESDITLPEWQNAIAQQLKDSHVRMGLFASGGKNAMTPKGYDSIVESVNDQIDYFNNFSAAIEKGELSDAQIMARVGQYSRSSKTTFYKLELETRLDNGFQRGKRLLDAQSNHCAACIEHQRPEWVDLSDIIAPGMQCECRMNCRCRIMYSKF